MFVALLTTGETLRAAQFFGQGLRTDQIARKMQVSESEVANSLGRLRAMRWLEKREARA